MSIKDQIKQHQHRQSELVELRNKITALEHEKDGLIKLHAKQMRELEDQYQLRLTHANKSLDAAESALRQAKQWTSPKQ